MPLAPRRAVDVPLVRINIRDDKGTNRPIVAPIYEAPLIQRVWEGFGATVEVQEMSKVGPRGKPWPDEMTTLHTSMAKEEKRLKIKYKQHPSTKEPVFQQVYGLGQFPEAFERAVEGRWVPLDKAPEPVIDDSDLIEEDDDGASAAAHMAAREAEMAAEREQVLAEAAAAEKAAAKEAAKKPAKKKAAAKKPEREDTTANNDDRSAQVADLCRVKGLSNELAEAVIDTLGITSVAELSEAPADEVAQVAGIGDVSAIHIVESATELMLQG